MNFLIGGSPCISSLRSEFYCFPQTPNLSIKVGKGIPESTPVEIPLAGYLSYEGISYVSLKQEPQSLQG
jgi:hypothetical protein